MNLKEEIIVPITFIFMKYVVMKHIESYINGKERLVKETEKKRWTGIKRSGKANK